MILPDTPSTKKLAARHTAGSYQSPWL